MTCTVTVGKNLAVAELMGRSTPYFGRGWWKVETPSFHIHAQLGAIRKVRFERRVSSHNRERESLCLWLIGPSHEALLRCYFTRLYEPDGTPNAAQFALWDELQARYAGGGDEVEVEDGKILSGAAA